MAEFVKRDPYARADLMRERENIIGSGCDWCGRAKYRRNKKGEATTPYLYRYYQETDGGHSYYDNHVFCSMSCRNTYYQ